MGHVDMLQQTTDCGAEERLKVRRIAKMRAPRELSPKGERNEKSIIMIFHPLPRRASTLTPLEEPTLLISLPSSASSRLSSSSSLSGLSPSSTVG